MADEEDIAALVIDNGSGMCKGTTWHSFGFAAPFVDGVQP
jgi:hypothetical protein